MQKKTILVHFHVFSVFDFISKRLPLHFIQTLYKFIFSHIRHKKNCTVRHFFEIFISSQRTAFIHSIIDVLLCICISNNQNNTFQFCLNMTIYACVYLCCSNTTVDTIKWHTSTWRIFSVFSIFLFSYFHLMHFFKLLIIVLSI